MLSLKPIETGTPESRETFKRRFPKRMP